MSEAGKCFTGGSCWAEDVATLAKTVTQINKVRRISFLRGVRGRFQSRRVTLPTMPQRTLVTLVPLSLAVTLTRAAGGGSQAVSSPAPDLVTAATGELRYRMIGPHRGGRTKAAAG